MARHGPRPIPADSADSSSGSPRTLSSYTDDQILLAYDNALADFVLAERYEHNSHLRVPIQNWLDSIGAELKKRGVEYSHSKVRTNVR